MMHYLRRLLVVLGVYLLFIAGMFVMQRHLVFAPHGTPDSTAEANGMHTVTFTTSDGLNLFAWYAPPPSKKAPVVVFFHGNYGHLGDRIEKYQEWMKQGAGVLGVEYRGYGGNPGEPTESGLYNDARAALQFLTKNQLLSADRIILYGESLGSGVASKMAEETDAAVLILEAPFTSIAAVGAARHPYIIGASYLIRDRFDSLSRIAQITEPLLVFHGTDDETVPYHYGKTLFDAAKEPKNMITIEGLHHNDLPPPVLARQGMVWYKEHTAK
ncbi:MAG: Alpha/beta hydrolase family protein [Rickettsiales bacterium]|jgi:fermentation-respiration switch protein FrsA (DUF1100 family)|nr:Alpha/beta hydrolase family protein [Rickettsiales bacterium]